MSATIGDAVSIEYTAVSDPQGKQLAKPLDDAIAFDTGAVRFVLGAGGFVPELHEAVKGMAVGETKKGVKLSAGAGDWNPQAAATLPVEQAPEGLAAGMQVMLANGMRATCTEFGETTFTIDANPPLAGVKLLADVKLQAIDPSASACRTATFAGGCFWGLELAYQREPGVVATAVGYTQGVAEEPTYEAVCSGATGHTEAVQVTFDPKSVSYERLCALLVERLEDNVYLLNQVGNDRGTQYRHGIYPEDAEQAEVARRVLAALPDHRSLGPVKTEVADALRFWPAEDYHQQYLQKGGQSAKKSALETIRCYG